MGGGGVSEDGDPGFQIAPMVDVVFVLLLFFMASAGSQVIEKELNISLPSGRSASAASSAGSKCSDAVGAATAPGRLANTVW